MATITIPINFRIPAQAMWINLDKKRFHIRVYWNTRSKSWYLSIGTKPDTPIKTCVPLLPGWVPFRQFNDDTLPDGEFVIVDSSQQNIPPGRWELGTGRRCSLVYYGTTV